MLAEANEKKAAVAKKLAEMNEQKAIAAAEEEKKAKISEAKQRKIAEDAKKEAELYRAEITRLKKEINKLTSNEGNQR